MSLTAASLLQSASMAIKHCEVLSGPSTLMFRLTFEMCPLPVLFSLKGSRSFALLDMCWAQGSDKCLNGCIEAGSELTAIYNN